MNKKYWLKLYDMFSKEDELREKYQDLSNVIDKIVESIRLSEETEKIQKELQELNKDED